MWVPSLSFALGPVQRPQQERPGPFETEASKVVEDGLPRREIGWQIAPGAAGAQNVEDRIENGTQGVDWWPAMFGQGRKMALQRFPLRVGKIAWVIGSHPFSLSHERSFAHFQNTLSGPGLQDVL
jgi:hypothetical protein